MSLSAPTAPRWSRLQIFSARGHDGMRLLSLDVRHETDAAGIVLGGREIQAPLRDGGARCTGGTLLSIEPRSLAQSARQSGTLAKVYQCPSAANSIK